MRKYYYLTKPGIIYSNAMTAAAGYLFGSNLSVDWVTFLALLSGNALIIASSCVLNNYIDRGIDAKMQRTKKRALVNGTIKTKPALIYASILALAGFGILTLTNHLTFIIGLIAMFSYVVVYGIAKRKTIHGTLVGTIPGAASLVAGYTAAGHSLDTTAALLFVIMLAWQMAHFYSIATFRFDDYKAANIPVWPVKKGMKSTKLQIIIYAFVFIIANLLMSLLGYTGFIYLVVMSALGLLWLWKGINGFSIPDDKKWARSMFGFSLIVLLVFSAALSINDILP